MVTPPKISEVLSAHPAVRRAETAIVRHDGQDVAIAAAELREYVSGPILRNHVRQELGEDNGLAGVLIVEHMPMADGVVDAESLASAVAESRCGMRPRKNAAAASRQSTALTRTVGRPGTLMVGSATAANASDNANRAVPEVRVTSHASSSPTTAMRTPVDNRWVRASRDSVCWCSTGAMRSSVGASVLMRHLLDRLRPLPPGGGGRGAA